MANLKSPGPSSPIILDRFNPGNLDNDILDDFSDNKKPNQPYILDLVTLQRLWFQTIPYEISNNAESTFVTLASPGRNVPFYNFSGSEKTLQFTITWYANHISYLDVISKCKWLESLSMADAYDQEPHQIQFIFGELYKNAKWLMKSCPFTLSNFDRAERMLPKTASQQITLVKVSSKNTSRADNLKLSF